MVTVDESGHFYFENQLCDEERLKLRLQALVESTPEPLVLVAQIDRNAKAEVFMRLGLLARSVGIREVIQAARAPVTPTPQPRKPE